MSDMEVRAPDDEHRSQLIELYRISMNLTSHRVEREAWLPLEQMRCLFDGDRVVSAAGARDFRQWFGGRELEMSGIWGVATVPESRGTGLATRAVTQLLHEARDRGKVISALYPATQRPYRSVGYELAGTMTRHEVPLDDLPRGPGGVSPIQELDLERDLEEVRACYSAAVRDHPGPIDCDDPDWWSERILGPGFSDAVHRAVVARDARGHIQAYASFSYRSEPGSLDVTFAIDCRHLVASTVEGLASLLAYFRGFRGLGQALRFTGPPAHPVSLLVEEQRVRPVWSFRWMLRLLHVPNALRARGYPSGASGEAVIAVEDGLFPDNRGPWRVAADAGSVSVEPAPNAEHARAIPIGVLSSIFSGYLSPFDAASLGMIDAELAPFLAALFAGPSSWMHDFF